MHTTSPGCGLPATAPGAHAKRVAWIYLLVACVFEVTFALATSASRAFTVLWPSVIAIVATLLGMLLLSRALRDLEVGIGYTVWVGIGSVGTVIFGAVLFGETLTLPKLACFALIIGGVIGLKLADGKDAHHSGNSKPA